MEIAVKPEIKQGGTPQPQQPPQGGIEDGGAVVGGAGSNASGNSGKQFPQGGNRRGNNAGGRGGRGGQNRFGGGGGGGGGGQRGAGNNQNFRGNRQNQSENITDNPGDVTIDDPNLPPPQQQHHHHNQQQQHNQHQQQQQHHNNQQQHHHQQQQQRGHKGQHMRHQRNGGGGGEEYLIAQKLSQLQGPTHDIPSIKYEEIKFSGRNRLYVGNLTSDATEEELKDLFKQYGEVAEIFLNAEKFFAFIKVDFRSNAEKAKRDLDGYVRNGRALRVRFAPNATTVRVKNLTQHVSNELLHRSFEIFGQVERAVIVVDDRGKPTGEGIVEFSRKSGAVAAIRSCTEKCFFLTTSLRPAVCDLFEHSDDTDGYPEKALNKKNQDFYNCRQMGPRFAEFNSFEHEYGTRWKQLHELYKKKHEALNTEMQMEEDKLEAQMEYARYEHETELLRNQLRLREQDRDQVKSNWEMKEKYADEQRLKSEEAMRRTQEEMALRMGKQEEELRRRQQENTLFIQAQHLNQQMIEPQDMNQGVPQMGGGVGLNNMGGNGGGVGVGGGLNNMVGPNMVGNMVGGNNMLPNQGGGIVDEMDVNNMIGGGNIVVDQPMMGGMGGGNPNQNQNQNRNKNFNRNFGGFNNQMGNQDDGGFINNFGNNNGGGGGGGGNNNNGGNGPNNNRGGNNPPGGRGGRQWNNNNNQQQQQQNMNDGGGGGGNNNFQNKRRRF